MAGANCKRYLQNKLVDRKRRRANSAFSEDMEMIEDQVVGDAQTKARQTTRHSAQKNLMSAINGVAKPNKTDVKTRITTAPSRKHPKSTVADNELLIDFDNSKNQCSSPEYDTMSFTDSDKIETNNTKCTANLENGSDCAFKKNDSCGYENVKEKQFIEEEGITDNEIQTESAENTKNNSKDSGEKLEAINVNDYNFYSSSKDIVPSLRNLNENSNSTSPHHKTGKRDEYYYEELGNLDFQNHSKVSLIEDESDIKNKRKDNADDFQANQSKTGKLLSEKFADHINDVKSEQIVCASITSQELKTNSAHQIINVSKSRDLNTRGDEQQQTENEFSNLSSSLSSENSSSSNPSCKVSMENINNSNVSNESKQSFNQIISTEVEQNKNDVVKSTNEAMKLSLVQSTNHPYTTGNAGLLKSPKDKEYQNYEADEHLGCVIKSSTLTINATSNTKQDVFNEHVINSKLENVSFQETYNKYDSPNVISSIATSEEINYIRENEACSFKNEKTLNNIGDTDEINSCKNNLKIVPTSLEQLRQSSIEEEEKESEKLHEELENSQKQNDHENESSRFDKYLEKAAPVPYDKFETESKGRITHQQLERDIIDAADKVYTQIEEQYRQQETSISASYEHMINSHQQNQSNPHEHDNHQRHDVVNSLQHMHALQNSMQQQHYTAEQIYQLQQQQGHHQQIQMQRHQMQKQEDLRHRQNQNLPSNLQEEHRHSQLMDFLHPQHHHPNTPNTHSPLHQQQQQHQIHEVYHDLMMDDFHEEHNTPYKLVLSPSTVKHENQDDGYETSAGDVLTPNSHASSTHSVTPQHHMQQVGVVANVVKCEEQHQQNSIRLQQSQHDTHVLNDQNQNMHQDLVPNESASNMGNRGDTFHFMDDDMNSTTNNNLRNILTPPHSHTRSNPEGSSINAYMVMQSETPASTTLNSNNDMYALTNSSVLHHHEHKVPCVDGNSDTLITNAENPHFSEGSGEIVRQESDHLQTKSIQKRRGRKKKILEGGLQQTLEGSNPNDSNSIVGLTKTKERKKHDRFNGMSEEEVVKRILPDHLCDNLDIVIIGINPGLFAAYKGHHYAGPGNHFWKCLYLSGLTQEQMNADEDFKLIKYGIGFTNMVQRATKGSADLTRKEIKEGSRILLEKLQRFRPKIAVFNGKLIFEVFSGKKDFNFGRQPECVEGTDTFIWVMPSSSARCAQLPRAADKVPFYAALKKFRDYLNGLIPHIDQSECVFTEERIKQQTEQENYKNQQSNSNSANDPSYAVEIPNTNNTLHNPVGYLFDSESSPHGAGPGPPLPASDNNLSNSFMMSSLVGTQQEKKKRGRPKKIKGQEIIDPITGNKIQVNSQMMGVNNADYANILNLSVVQVPNSEMPKKKRGRPKKVKPHPNMMQQDITQSTSMLSQKPNIMSIQSLTSEITQSSPHHMQGLQANHQHVSLYSTPPPHQRNIYSPMASPMASPSLNCSYTTNTPPSQPHHDKLGLSNNGRESSKTTSADLVATAHHQHHIHDQNYGESPPPSSPNICAVDFEPPNGSTATSSVPNENINSDVSGLHQRLHTSHQRSRFNSPISGEATPDHNTNEHFQQWLSPQPNHNMHSPASASTMFANSPQQPPLNYHDHQQQMQAMQQQQPQNQETPTQWSLRQQSRYDDLGNTPYMLSSQLHAHPQVNHNHQSQHSSSDVARKSLSGLESLVDQIPTISESESIALTSAAVVNAQVAAAAAVESRLQGMQNSSLADAHVGDDSHFSSISGPQNLLTTSNSPTSASTNNNQMQQSNNASNILNSNFSVSNLAASSATSSANGCNSHESYGLTSNTRPVPNPNAYHHSNLMAAAVLAAAAANTSPNLSTPAAGGTNNHHSSMYMDPHAHLTTHVPVNSIYSSAAPPTHHHHHSAVAAHHHHAAAHYGSVQHSAADYAASSNPYAAAQSNVTSSHTLHMPSPNYPYGYSTASTQSNYSAYSHSHHANHHGHPHAHHPAHHLAMFDRLKPSDITGYSSGF